MEVSEAVKEPVKEVSEEDLEAHTIMEAVDSADSEVDSDLAAKSKVNILSLPISINSTVFVAFEF